jgi:hypothetical protein
MTLVPTHIQLPPDDVALLETVRDFARDELLSLDRECDRDESSVAVALPKLGEMGLLSLLVPGELGGLDCRYTMYAAILHELAVYSPSTCVSVAVHSMVGAILARSAAEPLRSSVLSHWGRPDHFSAFALSEAGAGSDARAITTRARKVTRGHVLNGEKMWITNGLSGRWFLTLARLPDLPREQSFCAFLVDGRSEGLERAKITGKMGIRGSETAVASYHDVFVPDDHRIGEPGAGLSVFKSSLIQGRVGIAAQATGIAEACLDEMVRYARHREQFGQPIGMFQAVGDMIAQSHVELEAAKALTWRAAERIEVGDTDRRASSMAKAYAGEATNRIAYRGVQIHGGAGFVRECRVEQLYRDARVTTIYEGTSEIQRIVIARELSKSR